MYGELRQLTKEVNGIDKKLKSKQKFQQILD